MIEPGSGSYQGLRELDRRYLMISPPTLSSLVECEWQENQCPSNAKEDKTDSIDLDPPVLGELPPGELFLLILLSRRIVYSIYYNSTLLLPVRGEGEGC